ncbi:hypothetical protein AB0E69_10400 [Kribbella sp. NPDC026611]|uniref:hypothetical protein n=1 Tax=Kribbella sp. NPDC026611 TaxID=3154911 RepID=UPI0033FE9C8B
MYDPVRFAQEVADEVRLEGYFAVGNTLIVSEVTREAIVGAVSTISEEELGSFVQNPR